MQAQYHIPVLLKKSVDALNIKAGGIYIDATFGGGGHSKEILKRMDGGKLIAFDQDLDAEKNAAVLSNKFPDTFLFIRSNFRYIKNFLRFLNIEKVDGVLADLGVSSHQFDTAERGFSFRFDANLDMRMNKQALKTAADIVNTYTQNELEFLFKNYGELRNARKIAIAIASQRKNENILTSAQLAQTLGRLVPKKMEHKFLAQIYQALRIEVNKEMEALVFFLEDLPNYIKEGGRLSVLTYHSLEDRPVKRFMKTGNVKGQQEKDFYGKLLTPFKQLSNKPIIASEDEIKENNRARSAKLRIATRELINN